MGSNQFWTVFKADALWCLCVVALAVALKVVPIYWKRWRARLRIKRDLRYVAPELQESRRYEMEVEAGLRPASICGYASPVEFPGHSCPFCGKPVVVSVLPGFVPPPVPPTSS